MLKLCFYVSVFCYLCDYNCVMISVTSENRQVFDDKRKGVRRDVTVAVDPFRYITIDSVCMAVYKGKHFTECRQVEAKHKQSGAVARVAITSQNNDTVYVLDGSVSAQNELASTWSYDPNNGVLTSAIARVPTAGYGVDQYSAASILWLQWLNVSEHLSIQHALNSREHQVPGSKYKLDGYDRVTLTAYEFNGCLFHGCPQCFPDRQMQHPLTRQSYEELFTLTRKKESLLKVHGYRVVSLWVEVEWGFYALSASKAIFRARTYNCNLFSPVMMSTWVAYPTQSRPGCFCESCGHPTSAEPPRFFLWR